MKNKILFAVFSAIGFNVQAADLNKTYFELGYSHSDMGNRNSPQPSGIQFGFGYEFENGLYAGFNAKRQRDTLERPNYQLDVDLDENLLELGYIAYATQSGRFSFGATLGEMSLSLEDRTRDGSFYRFHTEYEHSFNQYFSAFARLGYEYFDPEQAKNDEGAWAELGITARLGVSSLTWKYHNGQGIDRLGLVYRYHF
ncbi:MULTISPECIES: hypothetical protein [Pseudoalteromonas]|uniref:Outer membrane protein beta-barrel domain-containing protein n=1 Tax=Pseudoalteromonas luteoviolacea (strain 2ta16) TaxID=1353533 RepID=V4HXM6_PSEL2|nr:MULTISPECIES: hypothetical protein [Pseudoalteromonas]ESP94543.1 hypothetical protein PL2TA16_00543 [Pseudoalteromonas luteoviolacea 2ta16]KZN32237.1 hypothetical protein N483_03565 [Pseudoalteromonas luteoviolacea NCIMB 1944]MCG7548036.1 hypothetical protein [Pseudoalteromonas sp. Of7M-16]